MYIIIDKGCGLDVHKGTDEKGDSDLYEDLYEYDP